MDFVWYNLSSGIAKQTKESKRILKIGNFWLYFFIFRFFKEGIKKPETYMFMCIYIDIEIYTHTYRYIPYAKD